MAHGPVISFSITGMDRKRKHRVSRPSSNPNTWVTGGIGKYEVLPGGLLTTLDPAKCAVIGAIDWYAGNKLTSGLVKLINERNGRSASIKRA